MTIFIIFTFKNKNISKFTMTNFKLTTFNPII